MELPLNAGGAPYEAPTIYHYTDPNGLIGIVSEGQLWATDIRYLNDSSEIRHTEEVHKRFLNEVYAGQPEGSTRRQLASAALGGRSSLQDFIDTYVVCFSAVDELLSQWNTYGARGSGFSIGFDRKKITEAILPPTPKPAKTWDEVEIPPQVRLVKVTYSEEQQRKEFQRVFDAYHDGALTTASSQEEIKKCARAIVDIAANSASYFKHHCFEAEQEWRIVITTLPGRSNVQFRSSARTVIPYVKIPLEKKGLLPITSVRIGPTLNQELSERSVKSLLLKNKYHRVYASGVQASTLLLALT